MVAYALAAQCPERVASLTMLDVPIPGTAAWTEAKADPQTWHFGLHRQRDIAEMLVTGREYDYLSTFYRARTQVAGSITDDDLAVYARAYAAPGALRAGFELYRAFDDDERALAQLQSTKLPMAVLAMAGELDNAYLIPDMAHDLAIDVKTAVVPGGVTGPRKRTPSSCWISFWASSPAPRCDEKRRTGDQGPVTVVVYGWRARNPASSQSGTN